jgi:hypothetical protein
MLLNIFLVNELLINRKKEYLCEQLTKTDIK